MKNKVYQHLELTGSSTKSMEHAVNTALKRAAKTVKKMHWFEVTETRGRIKKNKVKHWQVTIKVGFAVK